MVGHVYKEMTPTPIRPGKGKERKKCKTARRQNKAGRKAWLTQNKSEAERERTRKENDRKWVQINHWTEGRMKYKDLFESKQQVELRFLKLGQRMN